MKHLLLTTIAAVVLVGCCTTPSPESRTARAPDIPIHDAANSGNIEAIKQHLAAGADVNAKANDGFTPLDYTKGKKEITGLLRKHGGKTSAAFKAEGK